MTTIYTRSLNQLATLFKRSGVNAYGEPSFSSGETVRCRCQDSSDNFIDSAGQDFVSKSVFYLGVQAKAGDRIALGQSAGLSDSHEIKTVFISPSINATARIVKVVI
jgi:hypothetical protein